MAPEPRDTRRKEILNGTKRCPRCLKDLPVGPGGAYARSRSYADGSPRWVSSCNQCLAESKRAQLTKQREEYISSVIAPRRAAQRLIESNPEVLAELVRRFHHLYVPLLEEERAVLLERRRLYVQHQEQGRARAEAARAALAEAKSNIKLVQSA